MVYYVWFVDFISYVVGVDDGYVDIFGLVFDDFMDDFFDFEIVFCGWYWWC